MVCKISLELRWNKSCEIKNHFKTKRKKINFYNFYKMKTILLK